MTTDGFTHSGRGRGESKSSPRRIRAKDKAAEALRMRAAGYTYKDIAATLGYASHSSAQEAVEREMALIPREAAKQLLDLEVTRCDELLVKLEAGMKGAKGMSLAKLVESAIKVAERRAKLLGLDKPTSLAVSIEDNELLALAAQYGVEPQELRRIFAEECDSIRKEENEEQR